MIALIDITLMGLDGRGVRMLNATSSKIVKNNDVEIIVKTTNGVSHCGKIFLNPNLPDLT
jgi:hypothetical protein